MGCTISNSGTRVPVPLPHDNEAAGGLPFAGETSIEAMPQSAAEPGVPGTVEALGAELQRFSVAGVESLDAATLGDDHHEDTSSSSSSGSSEDLTSELHPADGTRIGPRETQAPTAAVSGDAAVGLLYDQSMEQHFGPDHFERPARIIQLHATLQEQELMGRCWQLVPRQAADEELLLAHSEEHIKKVDIMFSELYPSRPDTLADANYCYADGRMGDVYLCTGTARAARFAAGCCVQAVQSVLSGSVSRVLAVVRPPGHHAECERAMGFCFFNNVVVAALAALHQPGIRRVAVLDWDVHHGNGIQNLLLQRPDALYISIHRDPKRFYPYTSGFVNEAGEGPGTGFNVNVPWLKKGMADGDYMAAFSLIVEPILESYQPDLVIVAAGFDAADGDPLGGCKLSPEGYAWMTERLMRFAGGRLVLALEGGYNMRVTSWCAAACLRALLEGRASLPLPQDKEHLWPSEAHNSLKMVYEFQRQHWPVLRVRSWTEAWEAHLKDVHRMLGANTRSNRNSGSCGAASTSASAGTAPTNGAGGAGSDVSISSAAPGRAASGGLRSTGSVTRRGSGGGGGGALAQATSAAHTQSLQEAFKARKAAKAAMSAAAATEVAGQAAAAVVVVAATEVEEESSSRATAATQTNCVTPSVGQSDCAAADTMVSEAATLGQMGSAFSGRDGGGGSGGGTSGAGGAGGLSAESAPSPHFAATMGASGSVGSSRGGRAGGAAGGGS